MRAIAEAQVRAGLLTAADRTIADLTGHDLLSADHGWEAAATLVTALAARGDLAAAASTLGRIPDFALGRGRDPIAGFECGVEGGFKGGERHRISLERGW